MTDWAASSLTDATAAVRRGETSSRDILEACLDRVRRLDPVLAAFVELDAEGAREAADQADRRRREGRAGGPLDGAVLAHKDMYYRDSRVSACGSKVRPDFRSSETATVLKKLDAAGALDTGRLVMVEFAMGPHGFNANYPVCRNPWDHERVPCGSSSGSGVAVAARFVHGSLGSDTGGSIRGPACVSGVAGLVPTNGLVSRHGVMPMSFSLDNVGPLARTARDCARLLGVIAGADPLDGNTHHVTLPDYEAALDEATRPLPRIGVARGYFDQGLEKDVAAALAAAAAEFARAGFEVRDVEVPVDLLSEIAELHPLVMKAEGASNHLDTMRSRESDYTVEVGHRLHAGFFIPATDYIRALKLRAGYLKAFRDAVFSQVDLLLTPVLGLRTPTIADTMGKRGRDYLDMVVALTRNTKAVNYLGVPAMSVPCGFLDGVPTAFQLIGRPFAEADLLVAADRYQRATDWHLREPPSPKA